MTLNHWVPQGLQVTSLNCHWSDIYVECNNQVNIITIDVSGDSIRQSQHVLTLTLSVILTLNPNRDLSDQWLFGLVNCPCLKLSGDSIIANYFSGFSWLSGFYSQVCCRCWTAYTSRPIYVTDSSSMWLQVIYLHRIVCSTLSQK